MENILPLINRRLFISAGLLPFALKDHDVVSPHSQIAQEIIAKNEKKTGWERLQAVFILDEFDTLSPELTSALQGSVVGSIVGACYGGLNRSKVAYLDFITKNKATQFRTHWDAKKKLQDQVTIGMAKGGFQWGWRLGYFTGTYVLISSCVSAYRGKTGVIEHVIGGMVTGGMYKMSLGARGVIVGSGLGAVLGGLAGVVSYSLLLVTGYSMEEVMYWRKNWRDSRKRMMSDALSPHGGINEDPLVKDYIERHGEGDVLPKDD